MAERSLSEQLDLAVQALLAGPDDVDGVRRVDGEPDRGRRRNRRTEIDAWADVDRVVGTRGRAERRLQRRLRRPDARGRLDAVRRGGAGGRRRAARQRGKDDGESAYKATEHRVHADCNGPDDGLLRNRQIDYCAPLSAASGYSEGK